MTASIGELTPLDDVTGTLRQTAFEAIAGLVVRRGGDRLVGMDLSLAEHVFELSLIGTAFPGFWIEAPLLGNPGFDLHVYYDRGQVRPNERFAEGAGFGLQSLFDWYFQRETGGVGVGFAHDLRGGSVATGAYVNFKNRPLKDMRGFFHALGDTDSHVRARRLLDCLPKLWRPWYLGMFPQRAGAGVRLGAFVDDECQATYAHDVHSLARDLDRVAFSAMDQEMLDRVSALAKMPYALELQLDATEDSVGETLGVDLTLSVTSAARASEAFADGGPAARTCAMLERWGMSDGRWRSIAPASLSMVVPFDAGGSRLVMLLSCLPSFLKVKWVGARPQPAKVYLQCSARLLG